MERPSLTRRRALGLAALGAAAAAAGCSRSPTVTPAQPPVSPSAPPSARPSPSPSPSPSPAPGPSPPPALPAVARWLPSPRESLPALKLAAADVVQALCTRGPGQSAEQALAGISGLLAPDIDQSATLAAFGALSDDVSTGEVVYPQCGGLDPISLGARTGSAIVVVRRTTLDAAGLPTAQTRVVDVRLRLEGDRWLVTSIPSVGGVPVQRPAQVSAAAARVLDNPSIELPDTARWDIHSGAVSEDLLDLLATGAEAAPVAVTTFVTGHSREVFGTATVSAHAVGRAVDIWRVAGTAVVDNQAPGGQASRLQQLALADPRTSQVGSPPGTDADGRSRRSFDDLVHEDHLHLAVRSQTR